MKSIGGYFELELSCDKHFPHQNGALVNSGRCALEYLLLGLDNVRLLYIPYYTCDVVLEPLRRLGISYEFYHIDPNLEIADTGWIQTLNDGEYILVNNYFGIKDAYIKRLCNEYAGHIIVDNSQAFFTPQYNEQPTLWSPRKFVGIPDGGIAKPVYNLGLTEQDISYDRCSHLLKRWDLGATVGYEDFHVNSASLKNQPVKRMSVLTEALLHSIDYDRVITRRKANYTILRYALQPTNQLLTPPASDIACPMVYPYLSNGPELRHRLIRNNIFVAKYWPNVEEWTAENDVERMLCDRLQPLPIDQRYDKENIQFILSKIL